MMRRLLTVCMVWLALGGVAAAQTQTITVDRISSTTNLTIVPPGDVIFNPTGNDVYPTTNYDLNLGLLANKWLTVHAAELWVETLVAASTMATIGGRILVGPTTILTSDLTDVATTIYVKHNQLANGDRVYLEADGKIEFMAITSAAGGGGPYSYTVTRNLDGTGANVWYAGDAVFNTGTTGDGFIDLYSVSGVKAGTEYGPTIVGNVRLSSTFNDWEPRWAIGNLNGVYGYSADTYGFAAGDDDTTFVTADGTNGFRVMNGATQRAQWDTSGNILIGRAGSGQSNVYITSDELQLRNGTTSRALLQTDGDFIFGDTTLAGHYVAYYAASGRLDLQGNLTVGSASGNLITNSRFHGGWVGWAASGTFTGGSGCSVAGDEWTGGTWCPTGEGCGALYTTCSTWPSSGYVIASVTPYFPATPSQRFMARSYVANHRGTDAFVYLLFYDSSSSLLKYCRSDGVCDTGSAVSYSGGGTCSSTGGTLWTNWCDRWVIADAPASTAYAQFWALQGLATSTPTPNDNYLFFARPQLRLIPDTQSAPLPYSPGTLTTDYLSALAVNTGALSVDNVLTIGSTGYIVGGATSYSSGTGFFLGYSSGYKFRIGTTTGQRLQWDGSNLNVYARSMTIDDDNGITMDVSSTERGYKFNTGTNVGMTYDDDDDVLRLRAGSGGYVGFYVASTFYGSIAADWVGISGTDLGQTTTPFDEAFIDMSTTTSNYNPVVVDSDNQLREKTNGIDASCGADQYVGGATVESGIITAGTCRTDDIGSSDIEAIVNRIATNPKWLRALWRAMEAANDTPTVVATAAGGPPSRAR